MFNAPADYVLTRWLFLRLLGIIYVCAFASFGVQASGLIGARGILPVRRYLPSLREVLGRRAYVYCPSLAWLNASNGALLAMCWAGTGLGLLLILGLGVTWVLFLAWALYLSLVAVAQEFLGYQWDALLLETGFLAIFLAPPSLLPGAAAAPPALPVIFLFRWLLFRLMFMSGLMKLASRDPNWRNLTAMTYHYETQPLPTPLAWYAFRAPVWFQKLSTLATLAIELVVPFLFFAPAPLRLAAGALTVGLQLLILLTGNYAFFNWLTIFLCVFLLDDSLLGRVLPAGRLGLAAGGAGVAWGAIVPLVLAAALAFFGALHIMRVLLRGRGRAFWRALHPVLLGLEAFRLSNPYGLFAVMTTRRPEIVVEGSDDMQNWQPYSFKYKPGDLRRGPRFVAPHQPRLDWQMWFAALGSYTANPWLLAFLERLLAGTPEVLALLADNPFPDRPRYVRAVLYDYHFTTRAERGRDGAWWRRERLVSYTPIMGRREEGAPAGRLPAPNAPDAA